MYHPQSIGDFFYMFGALILKLVLGTLLSMIFVIFGSILYQFADATGTVDIFGQESVIGYLYKTLPIVDALIRGEFFDALSQLPFLFFLR